MIMRFVGELQWLETLQNGLTYNHAESAKLTAVEVKLELQKLVPEYAPHLDGKTR